MTPSPWLYAFLEQWERFRPTAYKPTKNDRWTIGYGRAHGVNEGDTCTLEEAKQWLKEDAEFAAESILRLDTAPLTQNQYDALCSLVFNIGVEAFAQSTLLHALDDRDYQRAADEFLKWDHQNGVVLAGLRDRRKAERDHFLS